MTGISIQPSAVKDILLGIFFCMLIISIMYMMPVMGVFAWMILPLPILFYRLKTGRQGGLVILLACLLVLVVSTGSFLLSILYFGSLLMTGFLLGECIEQHFGIEKIVLYTGVGVFIVSVGCFMAYVMTVYHGLDQFLADYAQRYKDFSAQVFVQSLALYPEMKLDQKAIEKAGAIILKTFPAIVINSYLTMVWVNILLIKKVLRKKGIVVNSIENLNQWQAPFYLVFILIGVCIFMFLPIDAFTVLALNSLIVLIFIYFFQGIAIASFLFQKKNAPWVLRFFFYFLVAIQPIFMLIVTTAGLFDTWFNFRKLENKNNL